MAEPASIEQAGPSHQATAGVDSVFIAECFWPNVTDTDLEALAERATESVAGQARAGEAVRYLGSILMTDDEVVLCLFEGRHEAVRLVAERAAVPFDRLVNAAFWRPPR